MDRYEMVENGDQHHNASFIKSVQNLKQPNKTKQKTQKYSSTSCVVKETIHRIMIILT